MRNTVTKFSCPNCRARIKAPIQLIGKKRYCPGCAHTFVIPAPISLEPFEPKLVLKKKNSWLALEVA